MTRPIRTALVAPAWRRWMCAGAASLLLVVSHSTWAQTVVRVTGGDGAMVLPNGPNIRLGSQSADSRGLVDVEHNRICCPGSKANQPLLRCVTERQVPLGASSREIIERYGPPSTRSDESILRYPGIEFEMSNDHVSRICAVR